MYPLPVNNNNNPQLPTLASTPTVQPPQQQQTPGGLFGNIDNNRYGNFSNYQQNTGQNAHQANARSTSLAPMNNQRPGGPNNASNWLSDFGPVGTGTDNFRQFGDQYYNHLMDRTADQRAQQEQSARQQLINSGLREGSAGWNAEMTRLTNAQNDFMTGAAVQAEQLGLGAQGQHFNQSMQNNQFGLAQNNQNYAHGYQYDALANALQQSMISAGAATGAARIGANASMYGQDQQNYRAQLAHALGIGQLNEGSRQFDINDISRTQQMDQNYNLGLMGQYNNYMNTGINQQLAQNQMDNSWWNMGNNITSQAPGSNFTGVNYVGPMQQAGMQQANAQASQNQGIASLLAGGLSMIPGLSDRSVKKNIEYVGREHDINVYEFDYIDAVERPGRFRGVMADEVRKSHPDAVREVNGVESVDYEQIPVDMVVL